MTCMRKPRTIRPIPLLATLALLGGCRSDSVPTTAVETVRYAAEGLALDEDPGILWDLLPPSYQKDLHDWCWQLAAELPEGAYDKFFLAVRKVGGLFKSKSELLANISFVKMAAKVVGSLSEDDLIALLNAIGDLHILIGKSEIASIDKLRKVDLSRFCHTTGSRLWPSPGSTSS